MTKKYTYLLLFEFGEKEWEIIMFSFEEIKEEDLKNICAEILAVEAEQTFIDKKAKVQLSFETMKERNYIDNQIRDNVSKIERSYQIQPLGLIENYDITLYERESKEAKL